MKNKEIKLPWGQGTNVEINDFVKNLAEEIMVVVKDRVAERFEKELEEDEYEVEDNMSKLVHDVMHALSTVQGYFLMSSVMSIIQTYDHFDMSEKLEKIKGLIDEEGVMFDLEIEDKGKYEVQLIIKLKKGIYEQGKK